MPSRSSLPAGFSWLLPIFRPTRAEVKAYAEVIRAAENRPPGRQPGFLRQAELQLWVWRAENKIPAPKRRRSIRSRDDGDSPDIFGALPAF
jgi:hypothetical protein